MTDKEIIKALECCGKNRIAGSTDACEHCFLQNSAMCVTELIYKTLDLINRQQAEIENYSNNTKTMSDSIYKMQKLIESQQAEIERLKHEREVLIEDIHHSADQINEQIEEIERLTINMNAFGLGMKREKERADTIRAEAIKEFAERLKESNHGSLSYCTGWVDFDDIDDLVKEMIGE